MGRVEMPAWAHDGLAGLAAGAVGRVRLLAARGSHDHRLRAAHCHWDPTVETCLAGTMRIDHAGGHCDLAPGQALVIAPGAWHEHAPLRPGCRAWSQGIRPDGSDIILYEGGWHWAALVPLAVAAGLIHRLAAAAEPERPDLLARLAAAVQAAGCSEQAMTPAQVAMALALWRDLSRPVEAAAILATSGLSERQAHRQFVAYYGTTPKQALLRRRLELAARYLAEGMGVAESARLSGFSSRAAFTRAWGQVYGAPPRRERDGRKATLRERSRAAHGRPPR